MSDPITAQAERARRPYDPPDSPASVGRTRPQRVRLADADHPLPLDGGGSLAPIDVEFEVYGELSPARDNAVLIFHALSGDAHVAGWDAEASEQHRAWRRDRPGWWDAMIGPGKGFDTDRQCVICANVLGSCYGTTGPSSPRPDTGRPYGLSFPVVTVGDWVRLQVRLLDHLGIDELLLCAGGSLGGQQVIELGLTYPERCRGYLVLAASPRLSAQGLGFNCVARHAIRNDPHFRGGDYYDGPHPDRGLGIARMLGHITYLSETAMDEKFGRRKRDKERYGFSFDELDFEVESYLAHQARAFGDRFDANSYLYITKAMDYYDAADHGDGDLVAACRPARGTWVVASFSSDWLYTPAACRELSAALAATGKPSTYLAIESNYGHDAFLVEVDTVERIVRSTLEGLRHG